MRTAFCALCSSALHQQRMRTNIRCRNFYSKYYINWDRPHRTPALSLFETKCLAHCNQTSWCRLKPAKRCARSVDNIYEAKHTPLTVAPRTNGQIDQAPVFVPEFGAFYGNTRRNIHPSSKITLAAPLRGPLFLYTNQFARNGARSCRADVVVGRRRTIRKVFPLAAGVCRWLFLGGRMPWQCILDTRFALA